MGNKDAKFKGQGKVLGTGEVVQPKRNSLMSKLNVATASSKPSVASTKPAVNTKPTPANRLTEEEKQSRRKAALSAAEAREKAWEERLARQRAKREKDEPPSERRAWNDVSPPPALPPLDPETTRKQKEAAAALEKSGFNPFQATVSSSINSRSVITNMGIDGQNTKEENDNASVETLELARSKLKHAMQGSDVQAIASALKEAEKYGVPEIEEARELLYILTAQPDAGDASTEEQIYLEDLLIALENFRKVDETAEKKMATASVLQTLLQNLLDHPEDPRYRKIRLENKTIKEKIVQNSKGKGIDILLAVGFERMTDEEGQQCLSVPHPDTLPAETVAFAKLCCETALSKLKSISF